MQVYNGVKFTIAYQIKDKVTHEIRCIGESKHCFLSKEGRPISLKRSYPEIHDIFEKLKLISYEVEDD